MFAIKRRNSMNKNIILSGLLLASCTSLANASVFVGFDYLNTNPNANTTGNYNIGATTYNYKDGTDSSSNINYKLGYASNSFRVTLNGGEKFSSSTIDYKSYGINFDYLFPEVEILTDETFKAFIGLRYGMGSLKDDIAGDVDINEYGVQTGLIFINQSPYELEFGVSYTIYDGTQNFTNKSGTIQGNSFTNATGSLELKDSLSFYVGLNYKF